MAASLSRSDPSSPASVAEAGFTTSRRGYHPGEVRAFLASVAAELGRLQERQRQLEAELHTARTVTPSAVELDDETVAKLLGEETLRVLHTARESASEIKIRAEDSAARILRDAHDEANRIRQETEVEVARKRYDASADAEAEVALAKQQGREMVNEARAYRERVLADLERRTTLARHQIEELVHGRDRLLQVFERARLVAVDVTSELQAIDGPAELVNLAPTTGPVPLMVPAEQATHKSSAGPTAEDRSVARDREGPATELIEVVEGVIDTGDERSADTDTAVVDEVVDEADREADREATATERDTSGQVRPGRDANVVSLFRGRAAHDAADELTDDDEQTDDGQTDDGQTDDDQTDDDQTDDDQTDDGRADDEVGGAESDHRRDVNGIFARLRTEALTEDAEPEALEETSDAVAVDADTGDDHDAVDVVVEPTAFSRRDEAIVPLIVSGARRIKRALADEQNGVLDSLRQSHPVTALDDLLPELDEHAGVYAAAIEEDLIGAAAAGAGELGINDTKTLRRRLAKTGALVGAHDLLRTDLLRPLRDRLTRAVSEGSGDNEDIAKRIRAVYREWKTQHIDDQLDDLFRFAHGGGLAVSVEPGSPLIWTIDPGHPACPDCEDNSLAGSVAAGDAFPTGHSTAPAHPGCRCLTLPAAQ